MINSTSVKIALIQMSMSPVSGKNLEKAELMIHEAAGKGAQIVCLPELFNTLYFPQEKKSMPLGEPIPGQTVKAISQAAQENEVVLVGGSICEKSGGRLYNTSVVFDVNGRILGKYRKVHVPDDPSFYEKHYFEPGSEYRVFQTRYGNIGVLICFDQWYPEAARVLRLMGADIIFYPTAIGWVKGIEPLEGDWHEAWESVQRGHAISNSVAVAAVNRVGIEKEMTFWGGSFVYDQFGSLLTRADDREGISLATCDFSKGKEIEKGWGFLRNRKPRTYSKLLKK